MLVDNVTITVKAGDGGDGRLSFKRTARTARGGPDGGDGGHGGKVFVQGNHDIRDLAEFRYKKEIVAEDGTAGQKRLSSGKNAPHITFYVPIGTQIIDKKTGEVTEILDNTVPILLCKNGHGGKGNAHFKSATNQAPVHFEHGTKGESKELILDLKLIADIGLIGLPNAGKSSILATLTNSTPTIGAYPFTTLEPNIGMLDIHPIADIPGLIEGAAGGKGLGVKFLKHIEKTGLLVHCVDLTQPDPEKAYETVRKEFENYNAELLNKKEIVLLNKSDLVDDKQIAEYKMIFEKKGLKVLVCSIYDEKSIESLKEELLNLISS